MIVRGLSLTNSVAELKRILATTTGQEGQRFAERFGIKCGTFRTISSVLKAKRIQSVWK